MFGTILKATNSSFKKDMTYCRSIYVTKVIKLLAFIFEQPSYNNSRMSETIVTHFDVHQHTAARYIITIRFMKFHPLITKLRF